MKRIIVINNKWNKSVDFLKQKSISLQAHTAQLQYFFFFYLFYFKRKTSVFTVWRFRFNFCLYGSLIAHNNFLTYYGFVFKIKTRTNNPFVCLNTFIINAMGAIECLATTQTKVKRRTESCISAHRVARHSFSLFSHFSTQSNIDVCRYMDALALSINIYSNQKISSFSFQTICTDNEPCLIDGTIEANLTQTQKKKVLKLWFMHKKW